MGLERGADIVSAAASVSDRDGVIGGDRGIRGDLRREGGPPAERRDRLVEGRCRDAVEDSTLVVERVDPDRELGDRLFAAGESLAPNLLPGRRGRRGFPPS